MASKGGRQQAPVQQQAQDPAGEILRQDGKTQVQRIYDPSKRQFTTDITSDPQDLQVQGIARQGMLNTANTAGTFDTSQAGLQAYQNALADPQRRAVNSAYDQAEGNAMLDASGNGMSQSAGFANYFAKQLAGQRAKDLADVESSAFLNRGQALSADMAPNIDLSNYYTAMSQGQQAQQQGLNSQNIAGAGVGINQLRTMQDLENSRFSNAMNTYNARSAKPKSFGQKLLGFSTGGMF
jgi:hypothetical protein